MIPESIHQLRSIERANLRKKEAKLNAPTARCRDDGGNKSLNDY